MNDPAAVQSDDVRAGDAPALALAEVIARLTELRAEMVSLAARARGRHAAVDPAFRDSAVNLLHYLALRRHDLRELQESLVRLGLSSLGRAEAHVLASIDAILTVAQAAIGRDRGANLEEGVGFARGRQLLLEHTEALLGPPPIGRTAHIMVTMPASAADDPELMRAVLDKGMDCLRINCAHDDPVIWKKIIDQLRTAERESGRHCRVFMDLGGPKLRTGPIRPGPAVIKLKPQRDAYGRTLRPARVWLRASNRHDWLPPQAGDATAPVPARWLARLSRGDRIGLRDARGAEREWQIETVMDGACLALVSQTTYLKPRIRLQRIGGEDTERATAAIGNLPAREGVIVVRKGDLIVLRGDTEPGHPAVVSRRGRTVSPAVIGCTLPGIIDDLRPGEPIWFDDGHIGGVIEDIVDGAARVRITHARAEGARLRSDKGINLPESRLRTPALTEKDIADLPFVMEHADIVGLSFASRAEDVRLLQETLERLPGRRPAIVLKIETRRGFHHLPDLLLAVMRRSPCGVMIARGDLAVECGFERLAEVQEELLWLCEAAHVPVIWATEVLDRLARDGMPSRAEITDAAMSHRAECVMLNKGPHIVEALTVLDNILHRMQGHQAKKMSRLRNLRLASDFSAERRH